MFSYKEAATIVDAFRRKWYLDERGGLIIDTACLEPDYEWDTASLRNAVCSACENGLDWGLDSQHMRRCIDALDNEQASAVANIAVQILKNLHGIYPCLTELPGGRLPLTPELLRKAGLVYTNEDTRESPQKALFSRPIQFTK